MAAAFFLNVLIETGEQLHKPAFLGVVHDEAEEARFTHYFFKQSQYGEVGHGPYQSLEDVAGFLQLFVKAAVEEVGRRAVPVVAEPLAERGAAVLVLVLGHLHGGAGNFHGGNFEPFKVKYFKEKLISPIGLVMLRVQVIQHQEKLADDGLVQYIEAALAVEGQFAQPEVIGELVAVFVFAVNNSDGMAGNALFQKFFDLQGNVDHFVPWSFIFPDNGGIRNWELGIGCCGCSS